MARRLDIRLNGPQFAAFAAIEPRSTIFFGFGRGIGKSWFLRFNWGLLVSKWDGKKRPENKSVRGVRILCLMPTLKQFKDVHWSGLEQEFGPGGMWEHLGAKLNAQNGQITFPGGSWIKPFPASDYNSRVARGMRCDVLCGDEIDDIDPDVYYSVAIPCLSEPWSLGIELVGGTPRRGRHGLWWAFKQAGTLGEQLRSGTIERSHALEHPAAIAALSVYSGIKLEDWPPGLPEDPHDAALYVLARNYAFHATYRDAPETVSAIAVARAKATTPEATFRREWEADPDAGEGLVYQFDERFHVREPQPNARFSEYLVGVDHGHVDAGVMLLIGIQGHGEDATAWVLEEHYASGRNNSEWDAIAQGYRYGTFYADPSRQDRINDWRVLGLDVRDIPAEVKPIRAGIARVAEMLFVRADEHGPDYARLYVHPRCRNVIRELGMYRRKKLADGSIGEDPVDKDNHTCDALRYAIAGRFGRASFERHLVYGG